MPCLAAGVDPAWAAVVGFDGGKVTICDRVTGVPLIQVRNNVLTLNHVPAFYAQVLTGLKTQT